jgi:epoxyqueuosine reductase
MKERIRERARELGLDDCRFAAATAPTGAAQFQKWLAAKHFGQMHWMERQAPKRLDPQKILPGAKSGKFLRAVGDGKGRDRRHCPLRAFG